MLAKFKLYLWQWKSGKQTSEDNFFSHWLSCVEAEGTNRGLRINHNITELLSTDGLENITKLKKQERLPLC